MTNFLLFIIALPIILVIMCALFMGLLSAFCYVVTPFVDFFESRQADNTYIDHLYDPPNDSDKETCKDRLPNIIFTCVGVFFLVFILTQFNFYASFSVTVVFCHILIRSVQKAS